MRIAEIDAAVVHSLNTAVCRSAIARRAIPFVAERLATAEVILMLVLAVRGNRGATLRMLGAVSSVYVACDVSGAVWPRQRPFAHDSTIQALVQHDADRSFPSRHVASGLAMATIGAREHPRVGLVMALAAWSLGVSRVAAGLHYPSDVVAGALLGQAIGYILRT